MVPFAEQDVLLRLQSMHSNFRELVLGKKCDVTKGRMKYIPAGSTRTLKYGLYHQIPFRALHSPLCPSGILTHPVSPRVKELMGQVSDPDYDGFGNKLTFITRHDIIYVPGKAVELEAY